MTKLNNLYFLVIFQFFAFNIAFAQPGCPAVNAGPNQNLACGVNCTNLTATPFPSGNTTSYGVGSIPYSPFSYTAGTNILVNTDDIWSPVINLPFTFCFFGNSYNQVVVGANGLITFDVSRAGQYCEWSFTGSSPIPSTTVYTNSIFGAYHDIDPSLGGTIRYQIIGSAPCRIFVISYDNVPMYDDVFLVGSCFNIGHATHQIVLYETTNAIEVYMQQKRRCTGWNGGLGIVGIQNTAGTLGYAPPGRNLSVWDATNEAWRFTPNGPSIVTVDWLQGGNVIGNGNTINVCPTSNSTIYTARATYDPCSGGPNVIVTSNVTVSLPGTLNLSTTSTNVSCAGGNNGTATATLTGGTGAITYGWSNGSNQLAISGLSAGSYIFTANDAANCVRRDTVVITQPPPINLSVPNVTFNNCSGTGSGDLSAIASGGTPGYTYAWSSTSQTDSILNGVSPGLYSVTLTDGNTCTVTASGTLSITNVPIVIGQATIANATCTSGGSIITSVSGGVGALTYEWSNGASTSNLTNQLPNTYTLTITDQGGCTASASYTINNSANAVNFNPPTLANVSCSGGSNGSITANGSGGTGTLGYVWSNTQTTQTISGLIAGSYSVTATDQTGCSASTTYTITEPSPIVVAAPTITAATCTIPGSIVSSVSGGTGTFTYLWSNGQTSSTAVNLASGPYSVTFTDQANCAATASYNVGQIGVLPNVFVASPAPLTCFDPSVTLTVSSSTPGATFVWSTSETTTDVTVSNGGTYSVTATNPADGCTASTSVNVAGNNNPPLVLIADPDTINCLNDTILLLAATDASIASYTWSNGQTSQFFETSLGGLYTVTVTNTDNGCTASLSVTVEVDTITPTITLSNSGNITCVNQLVDITLLTNAQNPDFEWSNLETTQNIVVGSSGAYTVTVSDLINGCSAIASNTVNSDTTTPSISIAPSSLLTCFNPSQNLIASSNASNASYLWNNNSTSSSTTISSGGLYTVTVTDDNNGCTANASENVLEDRVAPSAVISPPSILTCTNLSTTLTGSTNATNATYLWSTSESNSSITVSTAAPVTLTVTNTDNGCTASSSVNITQNVTPPSITLSTPPFLGCAITSVSITANTNAQSPVYSWSSGSGSPTINVTISGLYTVTVTNSANGCSASSTRIVRDAPLLTLTDEVNNPLCQTFPNSGSISITVLTGSPTYNYLWSNGITTSFNTNLSNDNYSVTITDQQGCIETRNYSLSYQYEFDIEASEIQQIELGNTTTIDYLVNGNSGILTNVWSPVRGLDCPSCVSTLAAPLSSTLYRIDVENEVGCKASDTTRVIVVPNYDLYIPNAFTPNNDGVNDFFEIFGNKKIWLTMGMKIFNRWGELVYQTSDHDFKWDGRYRGQLLTPQVLTYSLQIDYVDGRKEPLQNGSITLIR
jgi:gliding motility-associated-like protein